MLRAEHGQTIIEYGLILSFMSVALIGALLLLEAAIGLEYKELVDALNLI